MSAFNWERFLKRWSQELLESMGQESSNLPLEVIQSGWLGYPGATEEQIARTEACLETTLPPSYREFLKITNGWRQTTPFIYKLWSTDQLEWFSIRRHNWIDAFVKRYTDNYDHYLATHKKTPSIPDEEYFVYGDAQDCSKLRVEYLSTALEISDQGDSAIYLLNPEVITEDGEWEAWFFGDWLPGADRYHSFCDMMQAEYENFLELRES
ncbi:MAG TPA: SMI1/KNR4 family protein [Cyanophyceae cyanobacterium]